MTPRQRRCGIWLERRCCIGTATPSICRGAPSISPRPRCAATRPFPPVPTFFACSFIPRSTQPPGSNHGSSATRRNSLLTGSTPAICATAPKPPDPHCPPKRVKCSENGWKGCGHDCEEGGGIMTVISIQSQVAHGHVGNSAAVFPLQACGIEVAAVPTALLSNHPHYSSMRGGVLNVEFVCDLLAGLEERGLVDTCKVLISGYLGSPAIAAAVIDFVRRAKARNPNLLYLCDPVMGDADLGFYVDEDVRALFCEALSQ